MCSKKNPLFEKKFPIKDKEGNIIDNDKFSKLISDWPYQVVKQDYVNGKYWISTVWLGVPYFSPSGWNKYFETMVFGIENGVPNYAKQYDLTRYETLDQAKVGHAAVVEEYKNKDVKPAM